MKSGSYVGLSDKSMAGSARSPDDLTGRHHASAAGHYRVVGRQLALPVAVQLAHTGSASGSDRIQRRGALQVMGARPRCFWGEP